MPLEELAAREGQEMVSRWFPITQGRIDAFAKATEDRYFIHTDPERARAETPWGGTIAHGFLTASLLSAMAYDAVPRVAEARHGVNYGFDRLRFVAPVPTGSNVRGRFRLAEVGPLEARRGDAPLGRHRRDRGRGQARHRRRLDHQAVPMMPGQSVLPPPCGESWGGDTSSCRVTSSPSRRGEGTPSSLGGGLGWGRWPMRDA